MRVPTSYGRACGPPLSRTPFKPWLGSIANSQLTEAHSLTDNWQLNFSGLTLQDVSLPSRPVFLPCLRSFTGWATSF